MELKGKGRAGHGRQPGDRRGDRAGLRAGRRARRPHGPRRGPAASGLRADRSRRRDQQHLPGWTLPSMRRSDGSLTGRSGELGRIDVLCNNAGINSANGPVAEIPPERFATVFAVNTVGLYALLLCRAAAHDRAGVRADRQRQLGLGLYVPGWERGPTPARRPR